MSALPPRVGPPGAVAVAALGLALVATTVLAPRWRAEAASLQAEQATQAERRAAAAQRVPPPARLRLPPAGDPAVRAADLLALALRHGVRVQRTQQRLERQGPVQRLALSQSVQGAYADLRAYLGAALEADAALALDGVQWRRVGPAAAQFEAELQWSVLQADAP